MLNPSAYALPEVDTSKVDVFVTEVLQGLSRPSKTLPSRFLFDVRGSELFEKITSLPEYYPTRSETAILKARAVQLAAGVPDGGVLIEFGSGSSQKTEILLERLPRLGAYVPVDLSESALAGARQRLAARFPALDIRPIVADFLYPFGLPADLAERHKTGFFCGSTIGNLMPVEASRLLRVLRAMLSPGGRLVVGVDIKKEADALVRAYDDTAGLTAAFTTANWAPTLIFGHSGTGPFTMPARGGSKCISSACKNKASGSAAVAYTFVPARASTPSAHTSTRAVSSRTWPAQPIGCQPASGPTRASSSAGTS